MSPRVIEDAQATRRSRGNCAGERPPDPGDRRTVLGGERGTVPHDGAGRARGRCRTLLRGGAFKPRTSPYSFQGLGVRGLEIMREVADELGMGVATEAMSAEEVVLVARYADMVQIGARNMDNRPLLEAAAASGRPILLKRGITATVERSPHGGGVHRGPRQRPGSDLRARQSDIRTVHRNSLDIAAVSELKLRSDLPVIVDPSHGTGVRDLVAPVALAGIAAGADGVMVEVHPQPDAALSDGFQSLEAATFPAFMSRVRAMAMAMGRSV